jgi:hypothetical protein
MSRVTALFVGIAALTALILEPALAEPSGGQWSA